LEFAVGKASVNDLDAPKLTDGHVRACWTEPTAKKIFMLHYFGYFLLWPLLFAFAILPGVLIGVRVRTWQSSVVLAEIFTVAVALILFEPTQAIFGEQLLLTHIALFPPLLLSLLIGHFGRPQ
jgi:hypothetical protein